MLITFFRPEVADLLFDCSRVLEYAKIRTVLQSITGVKKMVRYTLRGFRYIGVRYIEVPLYEAI